MKYYICQKNNYIVTTDPTAFDIDVIYGYLTRSYWKRGVPKDQVIQAIEHSLNFGLFDDTVQIGFARVITDYTDFAYLCDVFVLEAYQGAELGSWMLDCILAYPHLQGLRQFTLATRDAHEFYRKRGFQAFEEPDKWMVKLQDRPWFIPE